MSKLHNSLFAFSTDVPAHTQSSCDCVFVSVGVRADVSGCFCACLCLWACMWAGGDGGGDGVGKIVCGCASFVSKYNALAFF